MKRRDYEMLAVACAELKLTNQQIVRLAEILEVESNNRNKGEARFDSIKFVNAVGRARASLGD